MTSPLAKVPGDTEVLKPSLL